MVFARTIAASCLKLELRENKNLLGVLMEGANSSDDWFIAEGKN